MNARKELIQRLAIKRRRKLGELSDEAFGELEIAVREDPLKFIDDNEEDAFLLVTKALERHDESRQNDDFLDDDQYAQARTQRLKALLAASKQALAIDESCLDARLLGILASDRSQEETFGELLALHEETTRDLGEIPMSAAGDAWADVFVRPRLRVQAALARTAINTARFRKAQDLCLDLLARAPLDVLGARFTCALAMARLEDEDGFDWLDAREGRHGNAWFHLGRAILMYKLGRIPAARRALRGYDRLCTGGAYLILQPMYVDAYLPDRPVFESGSFEESLLCTHEADPIISDIPDFPAWASAQTGFLASAQSFCKRNGFEWRDWNEQL